MDAKDAIEVGDNMRSFEILVSALKDLSDRQIHAIRTADVDTLVDARKAARAT